MPDPINCSAPAAVRRFQETPTDSISTWHEISDGLALSEGSTLWGVTGGTWGGACRSH